jgi:ferredoxin-NADP reductase
MTNHCEIFKASITSINQESKKIKVFRLYYGNRKFSFKPGQWIDLHLAIPGKNIGGYTIVSVPSDLGFIDLAIRESLNHPVTIFLHQEAKIGSEVMITEGQGKFFLQEEFVNSPITFIAGGIGITPILSMFRSLDKKLNPPKIFYSISTEEDILFKNELNPYTVFTITKNTNSKWDGEKSRINLSLLKKYQTNFESHFFICGPKMMIEDLVLELKTFGVPKEKIHFEKWW